jgi:hypothetical protein
VVVESGAFLGAGAVCAPRVRIGRNAVVGAGAVVDVPDYDGNFADAVFFLGVSGGDGDVVEDAEAHAFDGRGVVAGGANGAEGVLDGVVHDGVDGFEDAASGAEGDFEGVFGEFGVAGGVFAGAEVDVAFDGVEVVGGVDEGDIGGDGISWRDVEELVEEAGVGEALLDGADAQRALGISTGFVEREKGIANQAGRRAGVARGDVGQI